MRMWSDCISCIINMSLRVANVALKEENKMRVFTEALLNSESTDLQENITAPEAIRHIWVRLREISGMEDPLQELKREQNDSALKLYGTAKELVIKGNDPGSAALKLAIFGNAIDIMTDSTEETQIKSIESILNSPLKSEDTERFTKRLEKSRSILYLGDNCGEIVFDKLFIEILKELYHHDITFVTRSIPVLNDATVHDARYTHMDEVAHIVENGIDGPLPGTIVDEVSPQMKTLISQSDLIISKGGGNYDTLTEEESLKGKITFLVQAKCRPLRITHNTASRGFIVHNF